MIINILIIIIIVIILNVIIIFNITITNIIIIRTIIISINIIKIITVIFEVTYYTRVSYFKDETRPSSPRKQQKDIILHEQDTCNCCQLLFPLRNERCSGRSKMGNT